MVCRVWHGWTTPTNADAYDGYLQHELFPRMKLELSAQGYRGYHLLRLDRGAEVEFVTMVWFESLEAVRSFAGVDYEAAVLTDKARSLVSRLRERCEHFNLSGFEWPLL